jgi:hypothetical protein
LNGGNTEGLMNPFGSMLGQQEAQNETRSRCLILAVTMRNAKTHPGQGVEFAQPLVEELLRVLGVGVGVACVVLAQLVHLKRWLD